MPLPVKLVKQNVYWDEIAGLCKGQQARKLQATLVRNYDLLTRLLTDGGEV